MKSIIIKNWQTYGDYMFFANIVSENRIGIILETTTQRIRAFGSEKHVERFKEELKKQNVKFEDEKF